MKKTLKKLTAMLLTALFMVNLLPTGASAAVKPTEPEIEPQDSGYFIYQYYDRFIDVPGSWNATWTTVQEDQFGVWLEGKIKDATIGQLKTKLVGRSNLFSGRVGDEFAEWLVETAVDLGLDITGVNFSVLYQRNDTHRPLKYLYHYTIIVEPLGTWQVYELATLI